MKIIVCDAGPIIHLHEAGVLNLLKNMGEIFLPKRVFEEISFIINLSCDWPKWLQVVNLSSVELKQVDMWAKAGDLHVGEAEAIVLAKLKETDMLLTDDSAARLFSSFLGIEVHGSLGVILWNAAKGFLSQVEAQKALNSLEKSSLWLSSKVFSEAQKALRDIS